MRVRARLNWFSVNLEPAGWPGLQTPDWPLRNPEDVEQAPGKPDLVFIQGARRFNADGDELLLRLERQLALRYLCCYRGFLTVSPYSDRQQVVYVNAERIAPVHHWHGEDIYESADRYGFVELVVDRDTEHPILVRSIDIGQPDDGNPRMAEARRIVTGVDGERAVIAGSFTPGVLASLWANDWRDGCPTATEPHVTLSPDCCSAFDPLLYRCIATPHSAIAVHSEPVTSSTSRSDQVALNGVITIFDEEDAR